jgi:hypothetical protein
MKIKTFISKTAEDIDMQVNAFELEHKVKFTQTNHSMSLDGGIIEEKYVYIVFYE